MRSHQPQSCLLEFAAAGHAERFRQRPAECAVANENCDYFIKTADTPGLDVVYSHTHTPLADALVEKALFFPRPVPLRGAFCLGGWRGVRPRLPSSILGFVGLWDARGEAELFPASGSAAACGSLSREVRSEHLSRCAGCQP